MEKNRVPRTGRNVPNRFFTSKKKITIALFHETNATAPTDETSALTVEKCSVSMYPSVNIVSNRLHCCFTVGITKDLVS